MHYGLYDDGLPHEVRNLLLGIDGCPAGWYVVQAPTASGEIVAKVYEHFSDILAQVPEDSVIAVDMPIGLLSVGNRACDEAARKALAPTRSSSVFPAPLRPVLGTATHKEASAIRRAIDGKGMSIQSFAITRKVHEVDVALEASPTHRQTVYEVHPELCFAKMNGGQPLTFGKKKAAGRVERTDILARVFGNTPVRLVSERSRHAVGADDVLDALAGLWTAMRIHRGASQSYPATPDWDERGQRMAIFY